MTQGGYVKDVTAFERIGGAAEPRFERQSGFFTPNAEFFICHGDPTPRLERATWRLELLGDGLERPLTLSFDDIAGLPRHTVDCFLECAGNHRTLFETVMGEDLSRGGDDITITRWHLGGVGMARWSGVRLGDVLALAGVKAEAAFVMPVGLDIVREEDEDGVRVPLPREKALDPDTIVAFTMNDEELPADHGFPARLIVPGWVGTYSIKWLGRIEVTKARPWVPRNTVMYVLMGPEWPQEQFAPARGAPVTKHPIRSSLALPFPAFLPPGRHRLIGYARGNDHPVTRVSWSADGGATWQDAEIVSKPVRYAWTQFACDWQATAGEHALITRATDADGETQPMAIPFNLGGYVYNAVHPHPVTVA